MRRRFSDPSTRLPDIFRAAVQVLLPVRARQLEAELGGDHHLVADRLQRLADHLLVRERAIDLGGVEEGHAHARRRCG